ncbi:hypothetical protein Q4512_11850 [Oceanihabitans sp. 2_MG-2023]|nr:hypothetical protein [Oceanihabitans sp. 2_MG-2023]MDO6597610.1 hypothetical protein [Oceanihabitans sp. 2_MG-2023]
MYTQKNKTVLEKSKHFAYWIKRKTFLILAALMIGMSNGIYNEEKNATNHQTQTEQQDKKD